MKQCTEKTNDEHFDLARCRLQDRPNLLTRTKRRRPATSTRTGNVFLTKPLDIWNPDFRIFRTSYELLAVTTVETTSDEIIGYSENCLLTPPYESWIAGFETNGNNKREKATS
eukprot:scaffold11725_cov116-Cylindrotheca_fusiformis.AAC.15